jgi:hypothetical protein
VRLGPGGQVDGVAAGAACDEPVELLEDSAAGLATLDSEALDEDAGAVDDSDEDDVEDDSFDDEPVRASFL